VKLRIVLVALITGALCASGAFAQKRKVKTGGAVCGDPSTACSSRKNFHEWDLPFNTGRNFVIVESAPFYAIVLKSVKLKDWGDCGNPTFSETERLEVQRLFEHNKVFAQNCVESGSNYYTNIPEQRAMLAVYAGRTLTEANRFLKQVQALNKYSGVRVRRMKIGINGT
jgi:hypothetical protein